MGDCPTAGFVSGRPESVRAQHICARCWLWLVLGVLRPGPQHAALNAHPPLPMPPAPHCASLCRGVVLLNAAGRFDDSDAPAAASEEAQQAEQEQEKGLLRQLVDNVSTAAKRAVVAASFYYTKNPLRIKQVLQQVRQGGTVRLGAVGILVLYQESAEDQAGPAAGAAGRHREAGPCGCDSLPRWGLVGARGGAYHDLLFRVCVLCPQRPTAAMAPGVCVCRKCKAGRGNVILHCCH